MIPFGAARAGLTRVQATAIPDSAFSNTLAHWPVQGRSNTTIEDIVGSNDGSANGSTNISGNYIADYAEDADGTDDTVDFGTLGSYGSNMDTDIGVAFTIEDFTTSGRKAPIGVADTGSNGNTGMNVFFGNLSDGDVCLNLSDSNDNNLRIVTSSGGLVDDGNKHRVVMEKTANSGSDAIDIWVDNSQQSTTVDVDQGFSSPDDYTDDWQWFADSLNDGNVAAIIDNCILLDGGVTSSEVDEDYNDQPWT
jgi:hypothetical protein